MKELLKQNRIENKILFIRGRRVIVDQDLAVLYGVETKVLNQAVKRNIDRFPEDFMFRLTEKEKKEVVTNCDHLEKLKFSPVLPNVFTEYGLLMAANVLNSSRAVKVSIQIVRVFAQLRRLLITHEVLRRKIGEMEKKYDYQFKVVVDAIESLTTESKKPRRRIGFHR